MRFFRLAGERKGSGSWGVQYCPDGTADGIEEPDECIASFFRDLSDVFGNG